MAPDINTLDAATSAVPRPQRTSSSSTTASRRTSQIMGPPSVPASASRSPRPSNSETASVPLRHPRPLTAAELYLECEKEQEAVVNRLTRELTALRAQSASVASNASYSSTSTSASLLPVDITDPNPTHQISGATHPTPSRRHRSSSSYSSRSIPTAATSLSGISSSGATQSSTQVHAGSTSGVPLGNVSQASADRAAAATGTNTGSLSRQPSITASGTSTPARLSMDMARHGNGGGTIFTLPHRPSLSRDPSYGNQQPSTTAQSTTTPPTAAQSVQVAMQHLNDTNSYRTEMEIVKAENEILRQRVRALERALRLQRRNSSQSDAARHSNPSSHGLTEASARAPRNRESLEAMRPNMTSPAGVAAWADGGVGGVAGPRERSESQSTNASSRRAIGVAAEDEVKVGESAGSVGLGRGI
ncbi:Hypothetical protein R9X50_00207400 [Acrodontium crateriforme]|uniref:Uncharacterized protein n=1 Tax=Acrodontium crateriforme TaxID=150365 RepID=A0AAQ3R6B9_9PEZI|nr:Hypothetical protein R9X50_00207400 [Acrodontium crateriforme]